MEQDEIVDRLALQAQKEKKLIFELNEKILQLNNLISTGIEISKFENHNLLLDIALEKIITLSDASSALINVFDEVLDLNEKLVIFPEIKEAGSIFNNPLRIETSFSVNKKRYRFILSEKETRKGVTEFNELDKLLLDAVARQLKTAIENEFLVKQSLEKERIEKELLLAAAIQQQIIPKELPGIKGYDLSGINIPSKEVGGDYFDCIDHNDGTYSLIIADVTGKGISAALLVNTLNAALYAYLEFKLPLSEMTAKLNKLIYNVTPSDKFITFFIAHLDTVNGTLDAVNAGHNPILLLRNDGTLDKIEAGGLGLGMLDFELPYEEKHTMIYPGDKLFLYTDGIPEAMNKSEEEYSDEKMISFFTGNCDSSAKEFIAKMVKDVKLHVSGEPQSDDITCLILKRDLI